MREVKNEKTSRMYFGNIKDVAPMPNLIQVQKDSYDWFIREGLKEVFVECSPIMDYSGKLRLDFVDYHFNEETKYTITIKSPFDKFLVARLNIKSVSLSRQSIVSCVHIIVL